MPDWLNELAAWWADLPPEWVLLLLLPLLVGAVGLLASHGGPPLRQPERRARRASQRTQRKTS